MSDCREEFEAWMTAELCRHSRDGAFDTTSFGCYKSDFVHEAWVAWKAGWLRLKELSE
ncbi:MAG: hypothetical protein ACPG5W_03590 [Flavobacteriales bacterium]